MADCTPWLALAVGNSRLHWGAFAGAQWLGEWHTPHFTPDQAQTLMEVGFAAWAWASLVADDWESEPPNLGAATAPVDPAPMDLWMASMVKDQGDLWRRYPLCHGVSTNQVPLPGTYPTLGVDRALALVGAGETYGWPVLVVDGGTALTLTAGADRNLVGGAIWPGLRSQFRALHDYTDGLPLIAPDLGTLPPRWATTTAEAMASGVLYSQLAGLREFITDWRQRYPGGQVVFTGGDGPTLATALTLQNPDWAGIIQVDAALVFWGLRVCRKIRKD
ncbi:MAG: pantothenate kinase [Spirulina sp.]